ncbi:MAG TPA: TylF/MycF/NovP-related O-methyltransferase [Candidatus Saccharimonadales bacterium]|nr:TylF/MycF/NovP-related O-methyltransferase [Candidatus Saccharimonadales bacterium]
MDNPDAYQHHRVPHTLAYQFGGHQLVSDQVSREDIGVVWRELEQVLVRGVVGDVVEFGCYVGTTSLFIRRLLNQHKNTKRETPAGRKMRLQPAGNREFHVYDSFEGLPTKVAEDASAAGAEFAAGKLAVSKKEFLQQFRAANLAPPIIHKCWFKDLTSADVPKTIAFAFLDGDFYQSILSSLKLVWPHMQRGGVVLIDDFQRPELPGVERAVHDFFGGRLPTFSVEHNIALFTY